MAVCTLYDFFRITQAGNNTLNGLYYQDIDRTTLGFSVFSLFNPLDNYPRLEVYNLSGSSYAWGLFISSGQAAYRSSQIYTNLTQVPDCPSNLIWVYGNAVTSGSLPTVVGKTNIEAHRELINLMYGGVTVDGLVLNTLTPVGAVQTFGRKTAPSGWLICDGVGIPTTGTVQGINAAQLSSLRSMLITDSNPFGVDGVNPKLPDLRGEFVRGWAGSRAVDTGRVFGTAQAQDWKGFSQTNTGQNTFSYSHGPVDMGKDTVNFVGNLFVGGWSAPAAAMGTRWNAADEVRPRNIALLYCIKY